MFVQSLPEMMYNVSGPSDTVALWDGPLWRWNTAGLGNKTLQSSTGELAATLTSASVWRTKGEKGCPEEIDGFFPLL